MKWAGIVLLHKGGVDYRGIGLLEPVWKVVELTIMNARLQVIELHDSLHGFTAKRGTGMATIEVKLTQKPAHMEQDPV